MKEKKKTTHAGLIAALFILPFFILYSVFTIWPVIQGVYVSLHKWGLMGKVKFVGLNNYKKFLSDKFFWESLGNTTKFVLISVPLIIVLALALALIANRKSVIRKLCRTSFYLPSVLSVSVISYITLYMASPYMGFINSLLHSLGLPQNIEPLWLSNDKLVWITLAVATAWWTVGTSMLLYLAALQDISEELYEAADIDGAGGFKKLFRITIPLLKPTTWMILLLQLIACFKVFGQIKMITNGGPGTATRPLIQYIYETAFTKNDMGYAAAMSYVLFAILVILALAQNIFSERSAAK